MKGEELSHRDRIHLSAAEGWLGLGSWLEANEELENITPEMRTHPDVLFVRHNVYAKGNKWEMAAEVAQALCQLVPDNSFGWVSMAFALHELKRTKEAWNVLLPVVDKFPKEGLIPYNLACYACQLGNSKEALEWLEQAIGGLGKQELRLMALDDPDLEPLRAEIAKM